MLGGVYMTVYDVFELGNKKVFFENENNLLIIVNNSTKSLKSNKIIIRSLDYLFSIKRIH